MQGLLFYPDLVDKDEESAIIRYLCRQSGWQPVSASPSARLVLQYGIPYSYSTQKMHAIPFTRTMQNIRDRMCDTYQPTQALDQCIVNRYLPAQGISRHIDAIVFGDEVYCLSLGSDTQITFRKGKQQEVYNIPRRSLYVLTGEARYDWTHEIKPFAHSGVRYSITMRGTRLGDRLL